MTTQKNDAATQLQEWQSKLASEALCGLVARGEVADFTTLAAIAGALADGLAAINARTVRE